MTKHQKITGREKAFTGEAMFQMRSGNRWVNVAHEGHLVYLAGEPGSMKSTILRYIAASGAGNCTPLDLFRSNLGNKRVVWCDGEQPKDIIINSVNQIIDLAGGRSEFMDMFTFLDYENNKERINALWSELFRPKTYSNIGYVIIDAGSHFITDINDFKEAEDVLGKLTRYAKRFKCVVFILSHVSNGGTKLFGSWGTKVKERASLGFDMEKRSKYFGMTQSKMRIGEPVAPAWFTYDGKVLVPEPYFPI